MTGLVASSCACIRSRGEANGRRFAVAREIPVQNQRAAEYPNACSDRVTLT